MDISTLTETETKAAVYDQLAIIEQANSNIKSLNEHLIALRTPVQAPVENAEASTVAEEIDVSSEEQTPQETGINEQPVGQA